MTRQAQAFVSPLANLQEQRERRERAPKALSLGQLMAKNFPEQRVLLGPWLLEGETAMIWAATGVGKSWLALSIALAVAGGGEVLGWRAPQPSRVRYIDGEMTERTIQDRLRMLLDHGAVEGLDVEAAGQNLKIESRQGQALTVDFHDLLNLEHQDRLLTELTRDRVDLVIFDNFTTLSDSLSDENSAGAMKPALTLMLKLKQAGIAAILVHHANKGGDNYRGSTAIAATFEVIMGLTRADDPQVDRRHSAGFLIKADKFRARRDDTMEDRRAFLVDGKWELDGIEDQQATRVVQAIRSRRYANQKEIADALGIDQRRVSEALSRAVALDMITEDEVKRCREAAKGLRKGATVTFDEQDNPDF
jgi:hypothetical protein